MDHKEPREGPTADWFSEPVHARSIKFGVPLAQLGGNGY